MSIGLAVAVLKLRRGGEVAGLEVSSLSAFSFAGSGLQVHKIKKTLLFGQLQRREWLQWGKPRASTS